MFSRRGSRVLSEGTRVLSEGYSCSLGGVLVFSRRGTCVISVGYLCTLVFSCRGTHVLLYRGTQVLL